MLSDVNNSEVKLDLLHKENNKFLPRSALRDCFQKFSTSPSHWQTLKDKLVGINQQLQIEFEFCTNTHERLPPQQPKGSTTSSFSHDLQSHRYINKLPIPAGIQDGSVHKEYLVTRMLI
jgi:hypothetical protein